MQPGRAMLALLMVLPLIACEQLLPRKAKLTIPTAAAADSLFESHGIRGTVAVHGNIVEVTTVQKPEQLQRGGALWAKVGPYIYLFSPATIDIFERYPGVAAVSSRTSVAGAEVARVMLVRDTLRGADWALARKLLAQALREGTARPSRLEELVTFGERFTTYEYNPAYVPRTTN